MSEIEEKKAIDEAVAKFRELMESQLDRAKRIKADKDFTDYQSLDKIVIGICYHHKRKSESNRIPFEGRG